MPIYSNISSSISKILISLSESIFFVNLLSKYFILTGRKPWKFGYSSYKRKIISEYLDQNTFNLDKWPDSYGFRLDERVIEYPWLFSKLACDSESILDAGSILNHRFILKRDKFLNKSICIFTLAPESRNYYNLNSGVSYVYGDLRDCPFKDNLFDTIISLSTIEHIGLDNQVFTGSKVDQNYSGDYRDAILELYRILKPGGRLLLSFPFGMKENLNWFQVFDKDMLNTLIHTFNPKKYEALFFRYYANGWRPVDMDKCSNARTYDFSLNNIYEDDYVAFSRSVCCLELYK